MDVALEPYAPREAPGRTISIVLALAMHLALAVFLIYGIRWQSSAPAAVEVSLVRALPESATPPRAAPEPRPEPKVEPRPEPKIEPKPPLKPDIVIKEKPKAKPRPEAKEPPPKPADPLQSMLNKELAREQASLDQHKMTQAIEREQAQLRAGQAAAAMGRASAKWADRINAAIKPRIVRVPGVSGNPEAVYEVTLLPDGSVLGEPKRKKSTGNAALDASIERAILQSSPLPKPDDPRVFQRVLNLTFRPLED
ncbi:MAG: TonB C-terminal domain-containing protein [Rhodocyclaceae bacterium]|jgi:colicin import membrane protein|nr:TonB C-terminal domain-containing protein [Rhodocyclaceae bacterium]